MSYTVAHKCLHTCLKFQRHAIDKVNYENVFQMCIVSHIINSKGFLILILQEN